MHWETKNLYDLLYCTGLERTHSISEVCLYPWDWTCCKKGVNRFSESKAVVFPNLMLRSITKFQSWFAIKPTLSIFVNNLDPRWISLYSFLRLLLFVFLLACALLQWPHQRLWCLGRERQPCTGSEWDSYSVLFFQPTFLLITSNFLVSVKTVWPPVEYFAYFTPFHFPSSEQKDLSFGEEKNLRGNSVQE